MKIYIQLFLLLPLIFFNISFAEETSFTWDTSTGTVEIFSQEVPITSSELESSPSPTTMLTRAASFTPFILTIPTYELLGAWELNGDALDISWWNNHWNPINMTWRDSGSGDGKQVAVFNGINGVIDITSSVLNKSIWEDFSWSMRFISGNINKNQLLLWTSQSLWENSGIFLEIYNLKIRIQYYSIAGRVVASWNTVLESWKEYVATFVMKNNTIYVYIDGVLDFQVDMPWSGGFVWFKYSIYLRGVLF